MFLQTLSLFLLAEVLARGSAWSYGDSESWQSIDPGCGGASQSPINIDTSHVSTPTVEEPLQYAYTPYEAGSLSLVNDGHFFGVNGQFGTLTLPDGKYNALQLRIHFPSEHQIDGTAAVGELQIFHQREGATGNDGMAVVAILLRASEEVAGAPTGDAEQELFRSFGFGGASPLPAVHQQLASAGRVDLGAFGGRLGGTYYHYPGSLTNPPCFQGIHWYVIADAAPFPSAALPGVQASLHEMISRPIQPLHDRAVIRNHLSLPGEFPTATGILFECKAVKRWTPPQRTWCCHHDHRGCLDSSGDPADWPSSFPGCSGQLQSPIAVVTGDLVQGSSVQPLEFFYAALAQTSAINDGRSLQVVGQFGFMTLPDGPYDATYVRIVFPSEHQRDGRNADGEFQIVHHRRGCHHNCTAIVAVPLVLPKPGQAVPDADKQLFRTIGLGNGLNLPAEGTSMVIEGSIDLNAFKSQLSGAYEHYIGSLTEPPCSEQVHWYVMEPVAVATSEVVDSFKSHFNNVQYRQPQPLNNRKVISSYLALPGEFNVAPGQTPTPAPTSYDCSIYQSDDAARLWCSQHAKVQQFRLPVWTWSYEHPELWPTVSPQCAGLEQSPIDLWSALQNAVQERQDLRYDYYAYEVAGERKVVNDGRVLRVDGDFGVLVLPDGLYQVKHFLFHFGSEHTIDGKPALGELQILHQKQGSHGVKDVAIVSLLLESEDSAGRPCEGDEKEFFQSLGFGDGRQLPEPGQEVGSFGRIDLNVFHQQLKGPFFHYKGSLTVPPCVEGVHWFVLQQPAAVAADMIASFNRLFPNTKHVRPTQPLNNREVVASRVGLPDEFGIHEATYVANPSTGGAAGPGVQPGTTIVTTTIGPMIECPFDCHSSEPADQEKREWCCGHEGVLCEGQSLGSSSNRASVDVPYTTTTFTTTAVTTTTEAWIDNERLLPSTTTTTEAWIDNERLLPSTTTTTEAWIDNERLLPSTTTTTEAWIDNERLLPSTTTTTEAWIDNERLLPSTTTTTATTTTVTTKFNCLAGLDRWEIGWSKHKKEWCCQEQERACDPYDCSFHLHKWEALWTDDKKSWCCKKVQRACDPYDCSYDLDKWEVAWSDHKRGWCCKNSKQACDSYDCNYQYDQWRVKWSTEKKEWCCHHQLRGCHDDNHYGDNTVPDAAREVTTFYDCDADFESWKDAWTPIKKDWCCRHEDRGCFDCSDGLPANWPQEQQTWCCQNEKTGCPDTGPQPLDPTQWPGTCRGNIQSPIDLVSSKCARGARDTPLTLNYHTLNGGKLKRDDYGLRVRGDFGSITLPDGDFKATRLTFRFPSDHTIDGRHSVGEMQIFHHKGDRISVVSLLLELPENANGIPTYSGQLDFLDHFVDSGLVFTPYVKELDIEGGLDLGVFRPQLVGQYYHYVGSLTAPPCTEMVHWYVLEDKAVITPQTLSDLQKLYGRPVNNRPLQAPNGRQVYCSTDSVPGEYGRGRQGGWDYTDTNAWAGHYPACGGQAQSPVYIDPGSLNLAGMYMEPVQVRSDTPDEPLSFSYHPVNSAMVVNNGHDIEVRGPFGTLNLPDGAYEAAEFRFHFPAEHTLRGSQAVGELQIVHERKGGNSVGLANIGILLIIADVDPAQKTFFTNIGFGAGGTLPGRTAEAQSQQAVDLNVFTPQLKGTYYHYQGSLTLPPCLEGVHWYVLEDPVAISNDMLQSFKRLFPGRGNNRPLQQLNGRHILDSRMAMHDEFPGASGQTSGELGRTAGPPTLGAAGRTAGPAPSPEGSAKPIAWDCNAGLAHWRHGWSKKKKLWCCANRQKGCGNYDCQDTANVESWGQGQRNFCCEKANVGCALRDPAGWGYDHPARWSFKYPSCTGTKQSPISISDDVRNRLGKIQHLTVSYKPVGGLKLENDGHLLRVAGQLGRLALPNGMYEAKEIRFHFPSEHKLGGVLSAGEMQIVHQRKGSAGNDDLAIISILLTVGIGGTPEDQRKLEFFRNLGFGQSGGLPEKGVFGKPIPKEVDLEVFRSLIRGRYFHYEGSLTTPPCSETVHWFVLDEPAIVEMPMVSTFKVIFPDPANNRPVQPLTDRVVVDSRIRVKDSCEYQRESGCQESGGIGGWFRGILGQSDLRGLVAPYSPSTSWWLVFVGFGIVASALLVRAVRTPWREEYQALICQDSWRASRSIQFSARRHPDEQGTVPL